MPDPTGHHNFILETKKMTFKWTETLVSRLKELVKKDLSDSQIGKELGTTKESIKSKRRRMFLAKKTGSFVDLNLAQKIKISKDRSKKYNTKSRLKDPKATKAKDKQYSDKKRNKLKVSFSKGNRKAYWEYRLSAVKRGAKKRGIEFSLLAADLELQWQKQKGKCFYSDISLEAHLVGNAFKNKTNLISIDRINSNKGYVKGNIQFVSYVVNTAKSEMSHKEFINICKHVSRKF